MKLSAQEDLKLTQAKVFARLSNFGTSERIAIKRNVCVSQISQNNPNEDTLGWNCRFKVCALAQNAGCTLGGAVHEARSIKV